MLRTQQTLRRLVRLCQHVGSPSVHLVPRSQFLTSPETRVAPVALRWFTSDSLVSEAENAVKGDIDAEAKERKLKILQMEVSVLRQEGKRVPDPDRMKPDQWEHLMSLNTKSARTKFYTFLWSVEMKRESNKIKKEKKREEGVVLKEERLKQMSEQDHIIYSLSHTSMFLRIYDATINHWHNNKLTRAMQFGQKLVLDCSYDEHMTKRECINAAKQLMFCFAENRYHDDPFDLHFCNANLNGHTMSYLHKHIPTMTEPHFPLNVHSDSYLDHFPKEQLVYLTPHCRNDLEEYNPDHIYIIGCMVDTMHNEPLSLAKAKKNGLKMARLPLDRYLQWGSGSGKSLTLNQMTHIMLDLKTTGDWKKSLSHVPRRKLVLDSDVNGGERRKWQNSLDSFKTGDYTGQATVRRKPSKPQSNTDVIDEANVGEESTGPRVNKFRRKSSSD